MTERFDEQTLRRDIVSIWGPSGAHVDLFDWLVSSRQILSDQKAAMRDEIARLRLQIRRLSDG